MRSLKVTAGFAISLALAAACADDSPTTQGPLSPTVTIPTPDATRGSTTARPTTAPTSTASPSTAPATTAPPSTTSSTQPPDPTTTAATTSTTAKRSPTDTGQADADEQAATNSGTNTKTSKRVESDAASTSTSASNDATRDRSATAAPTTASKTTSRSSPASGPQSAVGPYNVGVMTTTLQHPDRPLTVEIWFPLSDLVDVSDLPPRRYSLLDNVYYDSPNAYSAFSAFVATDQEFPLVVYSHGSGGMRYIDSAFTEALASHGYVVAAVDHIGNTATDMLAGVNDPLDEIMLNRPNDVRRVIDALTGVSGVVSTDKIGAIVDVVDTEHIAVSGHSIGGATAISSVTGFETDGGSDAPDDRVDAVVLLAPAVDGVFATDQLDALAVPMIVVTASDDQTTPVAANVDPLWNATTNTPAYEVDLIGAEHNSFTDMCAYQDSFAARPDVPKLITSTVDRYALEGCADDDMDSERAHDLTEMYVVGFLDQVFRGSPPIAADSAPDDVNIKTRP